MFRRPDQGEVAVTLEQVDVGVDIVVGGYGVENEVEGTGMFLHLFSIGRDDDFVGTQAERVLFFPGRGGEDDDMGSEGTGELDPHVPESTQACYTNLLALGDTPVAHGGVGRDPGAEQ